MKTLEERAGAQAQRAHNNILNHIHNNTLSIDHIDKGFEECYIAGAKEALASQWRSVDDERPEFMKIVLGHIKNDKWDRYEMVYIDYNYRWNLKDVVEWMPIPEPPKPTDK